MRKLLATLPLIGLLVFGLALQAQAHNFEGGGDCDGWTLVLDGDFGATEIYVDGEPVGLGLTYNIPDDSDDESRTFVVLWDKPQNDETVTHTLERDLNECTPDEETTTTTSLPGSTTTTTVEESTTTTTTPETTTTPTTPSTTTPTTQPVPTSTVPGLLETEFGANVVCLPNGHFTLTGIFNEGIAHLEVSLSDPFFPIDPDNFDGVILTPENPTTGGNFASFAQFSVLGVAEAGYSIVGENPILVDVQLCPTASPVAETPTSAAIETAPVETLPFTGPEDTAALIVLGLGLLGLGASMVRSAKCDTE